MGEGLEKRRGVKPGGRPSRGQEPPTKAEAQEGGRSQVSKKVKRRQPWPDYNCEVSVTMTAWLTLPRASQTLRHREGKGLSQGHTATQPLGDEKGEHLGPALPSLPIGHCGVGSLSF